MKVVYRTAVRTFLCAGLLLGSGALARAQEPPEPTSRQDSPVVDNSKVNEHDRIKSEPTADQQKDNRSDRDITQQIQQSIMNDKSLSTYAHNVKIITQNGQVTLKGPVRSDDEKRTVEAKATEVAGENKVGREIPITDMTPDQNYYGFEGGLYESGLNTVPSDHNSEGVTFAGQVQQLNARGSPSSSGKIGWLCIGFSNVDSECSNFIVQAKDSSAVNNSSIVFVDGALRGPFSVRPNAQEGNGGGISENDVVSVSFSAEDPGRGLLGASADELRTRFQDLGRANISQPSAGVEATAPRTPLSNGARRLPRCRAMDTSGGSRNNPRGSGPAAQSGSVGLVRG